MKVLCVLLAIAIFVMATIVACDIWSKFIVIPVAVLVICYLWACIVNVQPTTAVLIVNAFNGKREARSGWRLVFRPFEWLGEINGATVFSLQKQALTFKLDVEAMNKEAVSLEGVIVYQNADLVRRLDFTDEDFKTSILGKVKGLASERSHLCKNNEEIRASIQLIQDRIDDGFRERMKDEDVTIEEYHGISVASVVISDPEYPQALKDAAVEGDIAKKRAEARRQEIMGVKRAAQLMVAQSKRNGHEMTLERAIEIVQQQEGKISKSVDVFGFTPETNKMIEKVPSAAIPAWMLAILGKIGNKGGGKRGGGKGGPGGGKKGGP